MEGQDEETLCSKPSETSSFKFNILEKGKMLLGSIKLGGMFAWQGLYYKL